MSTISASTTSTTAFKVTSDTTGTLVFQTGASPTTAMTLGSDQSVTFAGAQTYTGAATFTTGISVQGLTVGRGAGAVSTNTAVGASALASNTTAADNTAVGYQAAYNTTTDGENTAIGHTAFYSNTTGNRNVAVGKKALYSNTGADGNTAVGYEAALNTTTSELNAAFGFNALRTNSTGGNNTALGSLSLYSNTTASNNTAVGYQAGYANTTGASNAFIGYQAGTSNTTGSQNSYLGYYAGGAMTTGSSNTIVGRFTGNQGGLDIRTASNNIVLSDGDGNPRAAFMSTGTNSSWVFTNTDVTNKINAAETVQIIGVTSTGTDYCAFFNCQTGTTAYAARMFSRNSSAVVGSITFTGSATAYNTSSDYRLKDVTGPLTGSGEFIDALQPKVGTWKFDGSRFVGFIAHEVQEVSPSSVIGEKDAVDEDGKPIHQAMEYGSAEFIANIVAELQSLRQRVAQLENRS